MSREHDMNNRAAAGPVPMLELAHRAAHDLRSPLNTLSNISQLFARRYAASVDEDGTQMLRMLENAAREMRVLIENLVNYADAVADNLTPVGADAEAALGEACAALQKKIDSSGADVRYDALPRVQANAGALRRIFQYLIDNALDYRRDEASPEIRISAVPHDGVWRFAVSDNGRGIAPEYHEAIFEPFKKLEEPGISGSGLGLAIVKTLVERHGGRAWVESQPGVGSTFYFTLPAAH